MCGPERRCVPRSQKASTVAAGLLVAAVGLLVFLFSFAGWEKSEGAVEQAPKCPQARLLSVPQGRATSLLPGRRLAVAAAGGGSIFCSKRRHPRNLRADGTGPSMAALYMGSGH